VISTPEIESGWPFRRLKAAVNDIL
jgi:hypothetical protein